MPLGSKTTSGTPLETRGAAGAAGQSIADLFGGNPQALQQVISAIGTPLQRLGTQSASNLFGNVDLQGVASQLLASPADQTKGLFAALQPFEQRTLDQSVAQLQQTFGSQGGRFSNNLLNAQNQLVTQLNQGFEQTRAQNLLQAQSNQGAAFGDILGSILNQQNISQQGAVQTLGMLLNFIQPGAPVIQQGLLPGLLQAGTTLGAAKMLGSGGGMR